MCATVVLARAASRALLPASRRARARFSARACPQTLYEDRPGKPGWISTGPAGSTIDFEVRFGARPLLAVSYLSSWDAAFGDVIVRMRKVYPTVRTNRSSWVTADALRMWEVNRVRLHGRRTDGVHASTTAVAHMQPGAWRCQNAEMNGVHQKPYAANFKWSSDKWAGVLGFGVPPHARATLTAELMCDRQTGDECKFKIVSVVSF